MSKQPNPMKDDGEEKPPFKITLLIGDFRESLVQLDSLNPYYPFETIMDRFKETARMVFSLRPEVTAIELEFKEIVFRLTPKFIEETDEATDYRDSPGY